MPSPSGAEASLHASLNPCAYCEARAASVCSVVDDSSLGHLMAAAHQAQLSAGQTFVEEDEQAAAFFNITRGTVRLSKLLPDGRRQITGFAGRGDFLGLAVVDTYPYTAEAIDEVGLCRFSRADMQGLLHRFPAMETRLLEKAAAELSAAQDQMLLLGRKTARERLASFLLRRRRACAARRASPSSVALPMSRSDIADYLGLTIETVSRTFTRLRGEKLIELPSTHEVLLLDPIRLEELAAGLA